MSAPLTMSQLVLLTQQPELKLFGDAIVTGISADTRQIKPGDLFVCMPSKNTDTHSLIQKAVDLGAVAVLVHDPAKVISALEFCSGVLLLEYSSENEPEFFKVISLLSREILDDPSQKMRLIGITGTNGKTTVAWLLSQALNILGRKTTYLGTLGVKIAGNDMIEIGNTTPFPVDFWNLLFESLNQGVQDFVFEASSHALHQNRFAGIKLCAGAFTNLTQDHLDYHKDMASYAFAKELLFSAYPQGSENEPFVAAINEDDPTGKAWLDRLFEPKTPEIARVGYGEKGRDLVISNVQIASKGVSFDAAFSGESVKISSPLAGYFNAWNLQTVVALMAGFGTKLTVINDVVPQLLAVPGRFESIPNSNGFTVIVDYAHTPDALESLLKSSRQIATGKLVSVFGCGGDRDNAKRPIMAKISTELADHTVFTADNPRTESLEIIMEHLMGGAIPKSSFERNDDRTTAISEAIFDAKPGDVIVIAGKGHEDYQIIGKEKFPMDDREICRNALNKYAEMKVNS